MNSLPSSAAGMGLKTFGQSGSGRSIVANDQLHQMLEGFQELSRVPSSDGYHALALTNAVNGLRGAAAPVNSYLKNGSATRRCIVGPAFEIEYELINYYGGPQTDVVILDIRLVEQRAAEKHRAALWGVNWKTGDGVEGDWVPKAKPDMFLRTNDSVTGKEDSPLKIGINGFCDDLDHAATMLPSHIVRGDTAALEKLQNKGYTIFYVPQDGTAKAGWRYVKNLGHGTTAKDMEAARILAGYMKEAHDKGLYVDWISHRGGSKVLTKAMEQLALRRMNVDEKQTIFLSDATSSHYVADNLRRKVGMNTQDSTWFKATPGVAQVVGGSELGLGNIAMAVSALCRASTGEDRLNKFVDAGQSAANFYKEAKKVATPTILAVSAAVSASTMGYSFAGTKALLVALGAKGLKVAASTTLASIPSLNEQYHSGSAMPLKQLLQKALIKK